MTLRACYRNGTRGAGTTSHPPPSESARFRDCPTPCMVMGAKIGGEAINMKSSGAASLAGCALLLANTGIAIGQAIDTSRPDPGGGPTRVEIALYLVDLIAIDGVSQSFTADLFVIARWRDPRLASPDGVTRRLDLDDVWNPRFQIANQRAVRTAFPESVDVAPDGTVTYRQRYFGDFSARLDLRDFPMDRHIIGFSLATPGFTPDDVEVVAVEQAGGAARASELSVVDWSVGEFTAAPRPYDVGGTGRSVAGLVGELEIDRNLGPFISRGFLSVAIIVAMSWVVFWIDPKHVPARLSVSVTAMLTLIAYRFLLAQVVPRVSYLTRLDHFLLGSTVLVLLVLIEVVVSTHLHGGDRPQRARSLDRIARVVIPASFVLLSAMVLWPA